MESQRVSCLTEGYLRGWLSFSYDQPYSRFREDIVINYIQDERLYDLLRNRLFTETVIRANSQSTAKNLFAPVFEVSNTMIGLKLPLAQPKDTIKKDDTALTSKDLSEWKAFLEKVNKK